MMVNLSQFPLLKQITLPEDLRRLDKSQLVDVANELREFLIQSISRCGGHFAAGLGTVELTVALHYLFNTPEDKLIWDVGHQAYPHKVLTGRRDQLVTIRQSYGLHPFPARSESEYDAFGVGHSSTSISAALGMAIAAKEKGLDRHHVAIIGDGAITAGMAFEALNHASSVKPDLLVILNDNDMSISENVGGLNNYFAKIFSGSVYSNIREGGKKVLDTLPGNLKEFARRAEEHMKGMWVPGTLFEELGFNYIGPVDGHDLPTLLTTLENMKNLKGPQFLHIGTRKGKGYQPAENDPIGYHGVPIFDPKETSLPVTKKATTYSNVFGQWLCDMAPEHPELMAITPAMREGSGMVQFSKDFPEQYFDVAIAEQHAVTLAAGMACDGLKPVVAIYSSFLQRAYDQLIHDVALQNLDVLFAIDRAGLVGGDGATHHGAFDLSYLRCIPNLVIMAPSDENECRQMLYSGFMHKGPALVRYPRGAGPGLETQKKMSLIPTGCSRTIREGKHIALLSFGSTLTIAKKAAEQLNATLIDMRFIKPLDTEVLDTVSDKHQLIITVEENAVLGGAGSAVNEYLLNQGKKISVRNIGLPDRFITHGAPEDLLRDAGLTVEKILEVAASCSL
ncbi:MAG TPA: 1-deoxy-D-xylulose-5-phosphate synthase [Aeromonadales bacterium]|nr:1-deoxy-D-xylulose-5-phosphate synthase [Aeromonadales bacterium]